VLPDNGGPVIAICAGRAINYNKVIVDGVTINEPGGTFDFGTLPLTETDHLEFLRGAQSTLYGSDAMTSVVQVTTRTGSTETPNCVSAPMVETWGPRMAMRLCLARAASSTTTYLETSSIHGARPE